VALATRDPALYAELAGVLRERHIPTLSLLPGERVPASAAVVLTSLSEVLELSHPHIVRVPTDGDRTAIWAEVESALRAGDRTLELIVGIDPGPRPGFAVLEGAACIAEGVLPTPEDAGRLAAHLHRRFPGRSLRFRVGDGDRLDRDRILNALLPIRRPVEVVDERRTTPRGHRRPRDAAAARAIARGRGRVVHGRTLLTITPGEVANLQRVSREDSGGRFTLPKSVAEGILRGEVTLSDALADADRLYVAPSRRAAGRRGSEPS
jgi:hypothetical protein